MGIEIATRKPAPPQYAVTTRAPQYAHGVFGSKPLLYNDLAKKYKKFFLATGDSGINLLGERFGIFHTDDDSAVGVPFEVDLQDFLPRKPVHEQNFATLQESATDHDPRHGDADAKTEDLPPALAQRLSANHLGSARLRADVRAEECFERRQLDLEARWRNGDSCHAAIMTNKKEP